MAFPDQSSLPELSPPALKNPAHEMILHLFSLSSLTAPGCSSRLWQEPPDSYPAPSLSVHEKVRLTLLEGPITATEHQLSMVWFKVYNVQGQGLCSGVHSASNAHLTFLQTASPYQFFMIQLVCPLLGAFLVAGLTFKHFPLSVMHLSPLPMPMSY